MSPADKPVSTEDPVSRAATCMSAGASRCREFHLRRLRVTPRGGAGMGRCRLDAGAAGYARGRRGNGPLPSPTERYTRSGRLAAGAREPGSAFGRMAAAMYLVCGRPREMPAHFEGNVSRAEFQLAFGEGQKTVETLLWEGMNSKRKPADRSKLDGIQRTRLSRP